MAVTPLGEASLPVAPIRCSCTDTLSTAPPSISSPCSSLELEGTPVHRDECAAGHELSCGPGEEKSACGAEDPATPGAHACAGGIRFAEHIDGAGPSPPPGPRAGEIPDGFNAKHPSMRERLGRPEGLSVNTSNLSTGHQAEATQSKMFCLLGNGEAISDYYEFHEEIYRHSIRHHEDRVVAAKRRTDGTELVVKIRTKRPSGVGEQTWRAIMHQLSRMSHNRHVLDILEILEDESAYYIVMPRCEGGELLEFLCSADEVPESECQRITREILTAVGHLHAHNIVHRDIKPENLMFDGDAMLTGSARTVKLLDWDTCIEWTPCTPKRRVFAGTPGYIAPEVLLGEATPQSDLFSVGVILYIVMTGVLPWSALPTLEDGLVGGRNARRMYRALKREVLDWDTEPFPQFPLARDLCQRLLAFEPEQRLASVEQALAHEWLSGPRAQEEAGHH